MKPKTLMAGTAMTVGIVVIGGLAVYGGIHILHNLYSNTSSGIQHSTGQASTTSTAPSSAQTAGSTSQPVKKSAPAPKPPTSPSNLKLTSITQDTVGLSWHSVKGNNLTYNIYRSTSNYYQEAQMVGSTTNTSYTDHVNPDTLYFYWVVAQDKGGKSAPQLVARVMTPFSWQTIKSQYDNAVVKIKTYGSIFGALDPSNADYGSGFFIDHGKYIVTCWHVVRNKHYVLDVYPYMNGSNYNDNTWYHAKVVKVDKAHDLALLQIYQKGGGNTKSSLQVPSVKLGAGVYQGESLGVLGHPGGEAMTLTTGTVEQPSVKEHVTDIGNLKGQISTNVPTVGGNSGSPVFNHNGRVVGVLESGQYGNGNQSYAVPITALKEWGFTGDNDLTSKVMQAGT